MWNSKSSVAVASFLPGRAKDLSAPLYYPPIFALCLQGGTFISEFSHQNPVFLIPLYIRTTWPIHLTVLHLIPDHLVRITRHEVSHYALSSSPLLTTSSQAQYIFLSTLFSNTLPQCIHLMFWTQLQIHKKHQAKFKFLYIFICRSQWSRGLRRKSAAARLLRL
jgi:hypothetical protein